MQGKGYKSSKSCIPSMNYKNSNLYLFFETDGADKAVLIISVILLIVSYFWGCVFCSKYTTRGQYTKYKTNCVCQSKKSVFLILLGIYNFTYRYMYLLWNKKPECTPIQNNRFPDKPNNKTFKTWGCFGKVWGPVYSN